MRVLDAEGREVHSAIKGVELLRVRAALQRPERVHNADETHVG
jgi:hypothetical protein